MFCKPYAAVKLCCGGFINLKSDTCYLLLKKTEKPPNQGPTLLHYTLYDINYSYMQETYFLELACYILQTPCSLERDPACKYIYIYLYRDQIHIERI
jgi:hypothetical protein